MEKKGKRPTIELTSKEYGQLKKQIIEKGLIPMTEERHNQLLSVISGLELILNEMKENAKLVAVNINKIDQSGNVVCEGSNNEMAKLLEKYEKLKEKEENAIIVIGELDEIINIDSIFTAEMDYGDEQETAIFKLVASKANACDNKYTEISMDLPLGNAVFGLTKDDEFEVCHLGTKIKGKIIDVQNEKEEEKSENGNSKAKVPANR